VNGGFVDALWNEDSVRRLLAAINAMTINAIVEELRGDAGGEHFWVGRIDNMGLGRRSP
jgi:hypothetical protein